MNLYLRLLLMTSIREEKIIALLSDSKEVKGWTLREIKAINPLILQHRILLEDNTKPYYNCQWHLSPIL